MNTTRRRAHRQVLSDIPGIMPGILSVPGRDSDKARASAKSQWPRPAPGLLPASPTSTRFHEATTSATSGGHPPSDIHTHAHESTPTCSFPRSFGAGGLPSPRPPLLSSSSFSRLPNVRKLPPHAFGCTLQSMSANSVDRFNSKCVTWIASSPKRCDGMQLLCTDALCRHRGSSAM